MIILDTNIISELMRPVPDRLIGTWLSRLGDIPLATTTITISEIVYGLERLPAGRRKQALLQNFQSLIDPEDGLAIHALDSEAAYLCGRYRAERENRGERLLKECSIILIFSDKFAKRVCSGVFYSSKYFSADAV